MFLIRLALSFSEFVLCVLLSVWVIYCSYRGFIWLTTRFDVQKEILKGNVAVAILLSSLMFGASKIMQQSVYPVVSILGVALTGGTEAGRLPALAGYAAGHLLLGFFLAMACMVFALKFFEKLTRGMNEEDEIGRGNVAVAVVMASVVLILSMFLENGVSALSKSLIPQPRLGSLEIQ